MAINTQIKKAIKTNAGIASCLACSLFLFANSVAKCPDQKFLWKRLTYLRDSGSLAEHALKLQLNELFAYERSMRQCNIWQDSTHALLLERIGGTYFYLGDFTSAAEYMNRSLYIINSNVG